MNKYLLLCLLFSLCGHIVSGQKIQYSKSILRNNGGGDLQLVADVNGYHHLIYFSIGKKPVVHIFDARLQLRSSLELNIKLPENVDISILKLNDYYVLYAHTLEPSHHQMLKINGDGTTNDLTSVLQHPADSLWNRSKATFQLFDHHNQIYLISHAYHGKLKQINSSIVKLDPDHTTQFIAQLRFPFDHNSEDLKQVSLNSGYLHVLKTTKEEEGINTLTLLKIHLLTGNIISKQFESGKHFSNSPTLRYNTADSSILVFSMLNEPPGYPSRPGIFMASLDYKLNELTAIRTITNPFRDHTLSSFYVEKNKTTGWINFSTMQYSGRKGTMLYDQQVANAALNDERPYVGSFLNGTTPSLRATRSPIAVRMVVLNEQLENERDSLVKNNGRYYKLHPWTHAQFVLQNKAYLLMVHELAAKRKGLVLMYPNQRGEIESLPVRVHHQFHFLLPLTKTAEDYFIVPFINKKELGLMKVTLNR